MAQGVLLVTCAVTFAVWATEDGEVKVKEADTAYLSLPSEEGELVLDIDKPEGEDRTDSGEKEGTEVGEGEGEKVDADEGKNKQNAVDKPVSSTAKATVWKANLRGTLDERVEELVSKTPLKEGGIVHYERLLEGEPIAFGEAYVLWRYDELAYVYWEAMKADAEKAKDGKLTSVKARLDGDTLRLEMTVEFEVTNKLLKLMMGASKQQAVAHITANIANGKLEVKDITAEGNKEYSETLMKLGSDFLFGTEDYKGYVRNLVGKVNASLGKPLETSEVYYGVIFETKTA